MGKLVSGVASPTHRADARHELHAHNFKSIASGAQCTQHAQVRDVKLVSDIDLVSYTPSPVRPFPIDAEVKLPA
jgi:hypothetical protein